MKFIAGLMPVGAIAMARAVNDEKLSQELLKVVADALRSQGGSPG